MSSLHCPSFSQLGTDFLNCEGGKFSSQTCDIRVAANFRNVFLYIGVCAHNIFACRIFYTIYTCSKIPQHGNKAFVLSYARSQHYKQYRGTRKEHFETKHFSYRFVTYLCVWILPFIVNNLFPFKATPHRTGELQTAVLWHVLSVIFR